MIDDTRRAVLLGYLQHAPYARTGDLARLIPGCSWESAHDEMTRLELAGDVWMMRTGGGPWHWALSDAGASGRTP